MHQPRPQAGSGASPETDGLRGAFPWMAAALLVSAAASWLVASNPDAEGVAGPVAIVLAIGLVVFAIVVNRAMAALHAGVALALLGAYGVVIGVTLACVGIVTGLGSVTTGFVSAALLFAVAAVTSGAIHGSLGSLRGLGFLVLAGGAIAVIVNLAILARPMSDLWVSIIVVTGLAGLTVRFARSAQRPGDATRAAWMEHGPTAALVLYLEVVNVPLRLADRADRLVGDTPEDPAWNARHGITHDHRAGRGP